MKKIVASVGLVAIGASGIHSASGQGLVAGDASKPWSISATLRGFYDDNTATLPNNATIPPGSDRQSSGFEVSPAAALAWSMDQTTITLGAVYGFKHYENIPVGSTSHNDNTFTFSGGLTHAFNEQISGRVSDSFVVGQEPDLLRAGNAFATYQRVSGDNWRNYGMIGFDWQFTPELGLSVGYDNAFYDYTDRGPGLNGLVVEPSLAGSLNRIENRAHVELNYLLCPETKVLVGYQFSDINYTADELISGTFFNPATGAIVVQPNGNLTLFNPLFSNARNSRMNTGYLGIEQTFSPQLKGAIRVGGSYSEYPNDNTVSSTWTPYVNATLRYHYTELSYVEGGFSYDRNATDVVGGGAPGALTVDAQSAVVYASVNHAITPCLIASLLGQFQNSEYHGGTFNNDDEQYYLIGLNLAYRFNRYFSGEVGYNFDRLASDSAINRSFDRNRVYIGVTASY